MGPSGAGFDAEDAKSAAVEEWNRAQRSRPTAHSDTRALVDAVWIVGVVLGKETDPAERERLFGIKERLAAMAREDEQRHDPPPEVIDAFARDCRCCPCCRQCPCPGVMAGGMCDYFACVHDERDMDDDTDEDDDGTLANW